MLISPFNLGILFVISLKPRVGWETRYEEYLLWLMMSCLKHLIHSVGLFQSLRSWVFWNSKARKKQKEHCLLLSHAFPEVKRSIDKPNYLKGWRTKGMGKILCVLECGGEGCAPINIIKFYSMYLLFIPYISHLNAILPNMQQNKTNKNIIGLLW